MYRGRNYVGHNHPGHNYVGHNYIGRGVRFSVIKRMAEGGKGVEEKVRLVVRVDMREHVREDVRVGDNASGTRVQTHAGGLCKPRLRRSARRAE